MSPGWRNIAATNYTNPSLDRGSFDPAVQNALQAYTNGHQTAAKLSFCILSRVEYSCGNKCVLTGLPDRSESRTQPLTAVLEGYRRGNSNRNFCTGRIVQQGLHGRKCYSFASDCMNTSKLLASKFNQSDEDWHDQRNVWSKLGLVRSYYEIPDVRKERVTGSNRKNPSQNPPHPPNMSHRSLKK